MQKESEEEKSKELKPPAKPTPPMALEKYTGTYGNDVYGDVLVEKAGSGLEVTVGPGKLKILMTRWDKDMFTSTMFGKETRSDVAFTTAADGSVSGMTVNSINQDGCGVFQKKQSPMFSPPA